MPELAYVNGSFLPIEKAMVPVEDRGYQFGDAVYEVIASYYGRLVFMEEHMARLKRSLKELSFPQISIDRVRSAVIELFDRANLEHAEIYLQISRGVTPRTHAFPENPKTQFVMTARKVPEVPESIRQQGAKAITVKDLRWGRCDIKTVQLLYNALAKQKALDSGVFDAIFLSEDNIVREATSSNLFIVTDGKLITHPLTPNILPGVTRGKIIEICAEINLPIKEEFYSKETLLKSDEVFLTGTISEVLSIVEIDETKIGNGKVGPIAKQLSDEFRIRLKQH
ncbi:MAG: D-amino acid aminotransferase [Desulfobacterales bacterium]|nr:D-amino acid aminotransferase [Deltaproteobacteria bacterium]NNL43647.1 D-amino acid aminotransferase [Desulfobacterales bacterium]